MIALVPQEPVPERNLNLAWVLRCALPVIVVFGAVAAMLPSTRTPITPGTIFALLLALLIPTAIGTLLLLGAEMATIPAWDWAPCGWRNAAVICASTYALLWMALLAVLVSILPQNADHRATAPAVALAIARSAHEGDWGPMPHFLAGLGILVPAVVGRVWALLRGEVTLEIG